MTDENGQHQSPDQLPDHLTIEDVIPDDVSSVESDRCWEEQYRGDSHKWLIRDAAKKKTNEGVCSTMKEEYGPPQPDEQTNVGIRKKLLTEQLYKEVAEEVLKERAQKPMEREFCTTYNAEYNAQGFKVKSGYDLIDEDLCKKYPLYATQALTYYRHLIDEKGSSVVMPGLTKITDQKSPFKRSYAFTKSVIEGQDE
ncbi:uncharacterized protein LOC108739644 [Agrilus planipennis]|uniref:Uncharacterized protein LOC108739644 n=1 Tax=Agrilus planipennis TaxID=224129 RepID=A0A1W4WZ65_AGRPL|nr:uncharacterized protein LOC108739644 [Agrilus planipennis]